MGGAVWGVWGRSPQPPEANGDLGAKPQLPEARGSGGEPPALENFAFFCKNNLILGLFRLKNNDFKRGLEIGSANKIKLEA